MVQISRLSKLFLPANVRETCAGTKTTPNIEESLKLAKISKAPLIISGGIADISDLKLIKTLEKFNIEGVIVGKAIYDGDIKLSELSEIDNA